MVCVKCYKESRNTTSETAKSQIIEYHAIFVYNGMSLCLGHFNKEFDL